MKRDKITGIIKKNGKNCLFALIISISFVLIYKVEDYLIFKNFVRERITWYEIATIILISFTITFALSMCGYKYMRKQIWVTVFVIYLWLLLILTAIDFIYLGKQNEGWKQSLFLNLGTGIITSGIVSFMVWLITFINNKKREVLARLEVMTSLKSLYFQIALKITPNCPSDKKICDIQECIHQTHRRYHEAYKNKAMVSDEKKTILLNEIKDYMAILNVYNGKIFNPFIGREKNTILFGRIIFKSFDRISFYISQMREEKDEWELIRETANLFDVLRHVVYEHEELKSFKLIQYNNIDNHSKVHLEEFFIAEPEYKNIYSFIKSSTGE